MNEYHTDIGRLTHEERASDGERLDAYLARVRPEIGDQAFWYAECDAGRLDVRDSFSLNTGAYTGKGWFIRWFDGATSRTLELAAGERPRMRHGYCHIVKDA